MANNHTRRIAVLSVIIAANVALSYIVKIPIPATSGFVNLVEAGIFLVALLGGARSGLIVGGMSGFLLDILAGYPQWMFFSLIIHGLEGWLVGYLGYNKKWPQQTLAIILGAVVMLIGYVIAGAILVNWPAGWASIPGNIAQNIMGLIVALILMPALKRVPAITSYL
ncbi:ECF transporter S component [Convivina intestini]|uniref:Putative membrane protein n=1 Tax=Convivina intestini TaxID=1505726 RepID=A0A2U1D7S2_9LACO|nr:ECF transporter S component [Convivina intestini]PVY83724.1 putative membrane protein [Convivina intestini]CAH1855066.1 Thiamine precursor transporter HmpT [Convivina intestini]SDB92445.1 Uncharacterized membrane protein [Leuconostocaceae bacterium R-53105]